MPVHLDEFRLNDDVLHADAEIIGPMDSYFYATWDRIDTAIAPLPHVGGQVLAVKAREVLSIAFSC